MDQRSVGATEPRSVFSIGHSNLSSEAFCHLLKRHAIEVLVDVRSHPQSRYAPHFSLEPLRSSTRAAGIRYVFLGRELGGRPDDPAFYDPDGHVLYDRLAMSTLVQQGLAR